MNKSKAALTGREELIIKTGSLGYNSQEVADQLGYPVDEVNRAFLKAIEPPPFSESKDRVTEKIQEGLL